MKKIIVIVACSVSTHTLYVIGITLRKNNVVYYTHHLVHVKISIKY